MTDINDKFRWAQSQDERGFRQSAAALTQHDANMVGIPVKVKRLHPDAKLPQYAHDGDAGADLFANESVTIEPGETVVISTGLAVEIPPGFEWQIRPRSGLTVRTKLRVQLGTIDSTYRGEVGIIVDNTAQWDRRHIRKGDKVAQGVIAPVIHGVFTEVDELDETSRGSRGFGSTGIKSNGESDA
jgi:dUTP pyrophosphatase